MTDEGAAGSGPGREMEDEEHTFSLVIPRETGESMPFLSLFFWRGADQETTFPDPNPPESPIEPERDRWTRKGPLGFLGIRGHLRLELKKNE